MAKQTMTRRFGGCAAMLVAGIAVEVAIVALCVNVFGLGFGSTFCFVLAALCLVLAFAACHDDKPAPDVSRSQEPQEDGRDTLTCPYCFSIKTTADENGIGFCYDCESYWGVEDAP